MLTLLKRGAEKVLTTLVSVVKNVLTLATFFSFVVLFVLFFVFLYKADFLMCLVCLAGIYTFTHLNKVL